jgi:hypothetical protein
MCASLLSGQASEKTFQDAPRTFTGAASSQTRGLRTKSLLDDNSSSLRLLFISGAQHQKLLDVAPTAHWATSLGAERYKSTRMMTSANTEDPWIDSFNRSKARVLLGYTQQLIFSKMEAESSDPQPESTTQPKARGLLHMECDFAIALPYKSQLQDR